MTYQNASKLQYLGVNTDHERIADFLQTFCLNERNVKKSLPLPKPCRGYNNHNCQSSRCSFVHICYRFVNPDSVQCRNDDDCDKGLLHVLSPTELFKLEQFCFLPDSDRALNLYKTLIGPVLVNDAKKAATRPETARKQRPIPNDFTEKPKKNLRDKFSEICSDHLDDRCHRGGGCHNLHPPYKTSFIWQVKRPNTSVWQSFGSESNDSVEKMYCDPSCDQRMTLVEDEYVNIDFENMTLTDERQRKSNLRRIETIGRYRTNSLWYWRSDDGSWVRFNTKVGGAFSDIKSHEIEKMYISMGDNEKREKTFNTNRKSGYSLHIQKFDSGTSMYQESPYSKTRRLLRRRPNLKKNSIAISVSQNSNGSTGTVTPAQDAPHNLCQSHLVYPCKNDRCPMYNYKKLFMWLVKREKDNRWIQLPVAAMDHLELEYMDPAVNETVFNWEGEEVKVVFRNDCVRTQLGSDVFIMRLYYQNESAQPWTWYWLENSAKTPVCTFSAFPEILEKLYPSEKDVQRWKAYASVGDDNLSSSVTSLDIESAYQNENCSEMNFSTGSYTYQINFANFEQKNLQTGIVRKIRRRPSIAKDLKRNQQAMATVIPLDWKTDQGTSKELLNSFSDSNCDVIKKYFLKENVTNISVWRIENHHLWKMYITQRDAMKKRFGNKSIKEALLFHGTSSDAAPKIIGTNFDWRLSGSNVGQILGAGTYFSPNINTAMNYCSSSDSKKHMFLALVLCGDYTRGEREYRRPPEKLDGSLYDSCVDSTSKPDKIAIFDQNQLYPLYLVTFANKNNVYDPMSAYLGYSRPVQRRVPQPAMPTTSTPATTIVSTHTSTSPSTSYAVNNIQSPNVGSSATSNNVYYSSSKAVVNTPTAPPYTPPPSFNNTSNFSSNQNKRPPPSQSSCCIS